MTINDIATVRTGLPLIRKKAKESDESCNQYKVLNLKCINDKGYIDVSSAEPFSSKEALKAEYQTQIGDVLVRLSTPYTAVIINDKSLCGYLIPSHFAVIRAKRQQALPEYILWYITRESTLKKIQQNSSGSTVLGTISSGFIASLDINYISLEKQKVLGELLILSNKEQELLHKLAEQKKIYNKALINQIYKSFKER